MSKFCPKLISRALFFAAILSILTISCKSEFEQVRTSGDPERIYDKAMEFYEKEDYSKAISLMEIILSSYRGTTQGEDLYFKYAYANYYQKLYLSAANLFETYSTTFPTSELREEADFMAAYSYYLLSPTYRLDQTYTERSIDAFQLFVNTFPNSDRVEQSNTLIDDMREKLEKKRLEEAKLYMNLHQYEAAAQVLENLLKDFPETDRAEEVRFLIVQSAYELAINSVYERQRERFEKTNSLAEAFIKRYPQSFHADNVKKFIANSNNRIKEL